MASEQLELSGLGEKWAKNLSIAHCAATRCLASPTAYQAAPNNVLCAMIKAAETAMRIAHASVMSPSLIFMAMPILFYEAVAKPRCFLATELAAA
jgi:hypothetical protein